MNPKARRNARQYALQAMYQWQISGTVLTDIEAEFLNTHIKQTTDIAYFKELIHCIPKQCSELDLKMKPYLKRSIEELDPIELAILRLAMYELINRMDIPYKVSINEALELAKKFGSVEGYKFVNGVLDQAARKFRTLEVPSKK